MSIQFENVKSQLSGIRAWGNLEQDTIVVQVRVSPGLDYRTTKTGKWVFHTGKQISDFVDNSDVGISDIYWKQDGEWLAKFGTIKSMCGLSNREIGKLLQRLQENGKFSGDMENSQWENVTIEDGELIFVDDWKDVEPEEFVVEQTPENIEEFDSWLDEIIGIIGEVSEATPEQLRKLGAVLDTLGKELEETEEEESVVEMLEDDEEEEKLASEIMEEIKKGNKHLIDFFAKIMETPKEVIETPVKPNESPIANQIIQEAAEKISKTCPVNEGPRHTDAIVDMVQKMQLMSTKEIEELWDMWTRRQERLANQGKPRIILKKSKPESTPSGNDWKEIDDSWEKDEKKHWKELKELKEELKELKEVEEKLEYTPPSKSWGPKHNGSFHGDDTLTEQEVQQGRKRHRNFLDKILDEMVTCEPMGWEEVQKAWEKTWKDTEKEWQRRAKDRRHKKQEERSKWDLFHGLSGKTPPWPKF